MDTIKPRELQVAARVADALVYAAGVAGVVGGALLFRDDQIGFAVIAWVLTFIAGAVLRLAAWAARALAELLVRTEQIAEELHDVRSAGVAPPPRDPDAPPDPYRRWGGWH
jgi:hypothetical protein